MKKIFLMTAVVLSVSLLWVTGCNKSDKKEEETTKKNTQTNSSTKDYSVALDSYNFSTGASVHDPSIFKDPATGKYYIFGSHSAQATSDNLISFKALGTQGYGNSSIYGVLRDGLAGSFEWAGYNDSDCKNGYAVWAPDIIYNPYYVWEDGTLGAYMLYYSASSTAVRSCIGFAVSKEVEKNYKYVDTVIYSGFTNVDAYDKDSTHNKNVKNTNVMEVYGTDNISDLRSSYFVGDRYNSSQFPNAIDPTLFFDKEGRLWMTYGSWSGGLWIIEVDKTTGQPIHNLENNSTELTDKYFGRKIAYGGGVSGEGPYIKYNEESDYYYLFTTIGWLESDGGYNMRMFRSKNPDGPYVDAKGNAATEHGKDNNKVGIKIMGGYSFPSLRTAYLSPGHNSVLFDEGQYYLVYHTRFANKGETHYVRVHKMLLNEKDWLCVLPFQYRGEECTRTDYTMAEVAGSVHIVTHGTDTLTTARKSVEYVFSEDGKLYKKTNLNNDLGTWELVAGTNYMRVTIGLKTYYGVVTDMKDEAGNECIVFSGVADDNNAMWGVKYKQK